MQQIKLFDWSTSFMLDTPGGAGYTSSLPTRYSIQFQGTLYLQINKIRKLFRLPKIIN